MNDFEISKIRDCIVRITDWVARSELNIRKEILDMRGTVIWTEIDESYEKGKKEMAANMYNDGMPLETIAKYAKESIDTVAKWLSEVSAPSAK